MKEEQVLLLKKQLEKQIEKWKKLEVSAHYLRNLKKYIISLEEIINTGDYNSKKSEVMVLSIKTILTSYKLQYQRMSIPGPLAKDLNILHKELIAITKRSEKKILSSKK